MGIRYFIYLIFLDVWPFKKSFIAENVRRSQPSSSSVSCSLLLMAQVLQQLRLVVEVPLFTGLYTFQGGCLGFLPSTVSLPIAIDRFQYVAQQKKSIKLPESGRF